MNHPENSSIVTLDPRPEFHALPVLFIPLSGNPPWLEGWYRAVLVSATFLLVVILGWITRQYRREYRNLRWDLE